MMASILEGISTYHLKLENNMKSIPTNKTFSENSIFIASCKKIGIKPTKRQASKFRNCRGVVYKTTVLMVKDVHIPNHALQKES